MVDAHLERRVHRRYSVQAASRVMHDASGRSFPCQCTDISAGGARLAVPATMPVRVGHTVRVSGADSFTEQVTDLAGGELVADVVRVDREALLTTGYVIVAVRFSPFGRGDDVGQ